MSNTQSTYKDTLKELIEVSNWLIVKINLSIAAGDITPMSSKINMLVPIAEKVCKNFSNQADMITIEEDLLLALENSASNLWNAVVLSSRGSAVSDELKQLFVLIEHFSSLLFLIFANFYKTSLESVTRAFSCFNVTLRHCLDVGVENPENGGSAQKISVKCEQECDKLLQRITVNDAHHPSLSELKNDFFVTCFQFSLQQGDFNAATIYWSKIMEKPDSHQKNHENNLSLEKIPSKCLIDLTRVIHNACMKQNDKNMPKCVDLLKSSVSSLQNCKDTLVTLDTTYQQIKLSTLLLLIQCLLKTRDFDACEKYAQMALEEFPGEPNVYKASIEMLKTKYYSNSSLLTEAYKDIFMKMVFSLPLQHNVKVFIGCLNDLSKVSISAGISCSDYLFTSEKLNLENDTPVLEQLFVNKIFNITQSITLTEPEKIDALTSAFDLAAKTLTNIITSESAQSLSSLLWTTGRKMVKSEHYESSIACFEICFHFLIEGQVSNKAIIIRDMQKVYLHLKDYEQIESLYEKLDDIDKYDSNSQCILFIALANKSVQEYGTTIDSCMQCLQNIKSADPSKFSKYFLSCLAEIEDNDALRLKLFMKLFENSPDGILSNLEVTDVVNYLTTCRVALQLFLKLLAKGEDFESYMAKHYTHIMQILKHALNYVRRSRTLKEMSINVDSNDTGIAYSYDELEWFAAVAYNLQCKCYSNKVFIENILFGDISLDFITLFKNEISESKVVDIKYRKIKCVSIMVFYKIEGCFLKPSERSAYLNFLNGTLLELEKDIDALFENAEMAKLKAACNDVLLCLFHIYALDRDKNRLLELLIMPLVQKCFFETNLLDGFVTILFAIDELSNDLKSTVLYAAIENSIVHFQDNLKLAELLRRLFSLNSSALQVEQKIRLCKNFLQRIKTDAHKDFYIQAQYEIDWLSTHCWNVCVDLVIKNEREAASQWFDTASSLANLLPHDTKCPTYSKSQKLSELWSQLVGTC